MDDGYVASSERMRRARRKRPQDFRRKILEIVHEGGRKSVRAAEGRWLSLIKKEELGVRYYNLKRRAEGGDLYEGLTPERLLEVKAKLSASRTGALHHSARAVIIGGIRYDTKRAAHIALGINPTKRLESRELRWRGWYYEDIGQLSIEECKSYEIKRKRKQRKHLRGLATTNASRPPEWHAARIAKGLPLRTGVKRNKPLSRTSRKNISKGQMGRVHSPAHIAKCADWKRGRHREKGTMKWL
jgi:hypothetical protein